MKTDLFIDAELNKALDKDGIVQFKLNDPSVVDRCQEVIDRLAPPVPENFREGFYAGIMDNDIPNKKAISNSLVNALKPALSDWISGYKLLSFTYLVKGVGPKSMLDVHQDWSMVDETQYHGYNLWMPMSDSDLGNGTLYALKGSHNFPLNRRGGGIFPKYLNNRDLAIAAMVPFVVPRGEAVIFDNRLIHYSPANETDIPRFAVAGTVVPENAPVIVYNGREENGQLKVSAHKAPDDFYFRYSDFHNQKDLSPECASYLEEVPDPNIDPLSAEELEMLLKTLDGKKHGFWSRLFS